MSRSHASIGVLLFIVYAMSFMSVATRRALRPALDTQRFDDYTEPFLLCVSCDEKMDSGHSILERYEATCRQVCFILRDVLVS